MYQHHSNSSNEHNQQQDSKVLKSPGLTGGRVGSADMPSGRSGFAAGHSGSYERPLPGMEADFPPEPPIEFNNSSQSLTELLDDIQNRSSRRDLSSLTHDQRNTLLQWEEDEGYGVGACLNVFPSGEISGGCYSKGNKKAPGHTGRVKTTEFTRQAKKKIRRAVDCKTTTFKLFITLTFDPKLSTLNESGSVCQVWAKDRFKQFLNTLKKKYDRMADATGNERLRLSYIWVAEIQEKNTKNIHFHILIDREFIPVAWLVKIWGQASNSVNVKRLNNQDHAVNYMLKYMKKGNCPIEGKRYGMTINLINGSKPIKYDFYGRNNRNAFIRIKDEMEWHIKGNNGFVADWGLSVPPPRRTVIYRGKDGQTYEKKGTSRKIGDDLLAKINTLMTITNDATPFDNQPDADDLPF